MDRQQVVGLGAVLGPMLAILGLYGRSRAALGASVGSLGCIWAALGAYVGDLGPLLGLYWRSWATLEPMLAVLGRSWDLCGRSGAEKCEEHGYLEHVFISAAGARSAA